MTRPTGKKQYNRPRLRSLGDVGRLTRNRPVGTGNDAAGKKGGAGKEMS